MVGLRLWGILLVLALPVAGAQEPPVPTQEPPAPPSESPPAAPTTQPPAPPSQGPPSPPGNGTPDAPNPGTPATPSAQPPTPPPGDDGPPADDPAEPPVPEDPPEATDAESSSEGVETSAEAAGAGATQTVEDAALDAEALEALVAEFLLEHYGMESNNRSTAVYAIMKSATDPCTSTGAGLAAAATKDRGRTTSASQASSGNQKRSGSSTFSIESPQSSPSLAVGSRAEGLLGVGLLAAALGLALAVGRNRLVVPNGRNPSGPTPPNVPVTLLEDQVDAVPVTRVPGEAPPPSPTLGSLRDRIQQNPLDGEARFELGLSLLGTEHEERALRELSRAVRLDARLMMRLLEDPGLQTVRENPAVRRLLRRYLRDQQQRIWASYA